MHPIAHAFVQEPGHRPAVMELPSDASAMDRVCAAFAAHFEMILKESAYTAAAMRTMTQLPPEIRTRQLDGQRAHGEMWRSLITAAADAGEIDPELDLRATRMLLLGAVNWAVEWWSPHQGSIEDITATIERFVRNALTDSARRKEGSTPTIQPRSGLIPQFAAPPE
ncbi:TetR/AcrR family transcriptional regulator [Saccharopolyspora sp. WRP15-2]|uniref:TetR/AcrR family transcriptional regulator n=1 Tax=Saccharopolyspora oryzae TaxID=2997343 RepID=A0ABT4V5X1_9PSEU|nr:TetR/AcrR family transcriptional regulator [Saccharopolyspora oryzae]MDA3628831.1 TetR/AcrR family transcriptional regulator [Saccharopolyspora oryzae]